VAAVPTGTPIDFVQFLPGLSRLMGGGSKSSSQSASSSASNLSVAISPQIVNGNPSGLSGGSIGPIGAPSTATTGPQSASLPSYLPGVSSGYGGYSYPSALNPNLGYTTNNAGLATGIGSLLTSPVVLIGLAVLAGALIWAQGK
jgi:hypothetical protein